jgi:hypothetical protein
MWNGYKIGRESQLGENILSGGPGFPAHWAGHDSVCGFHHGKPPELHQSQPAPQEIRRPGLIVRGNLWR